MSESPDTQAEAVCKRRPHYYGESCDCEARLAEVTVHTRAQYGNDPSHCQECSAAIQEWVSWPCEGAPTPSAEPDGEACYVNGEFVSETHTTNEADGPCVVCGRPAPAQDGAEVEALARVLAVAHTEHRDSTPIIRSRRAAEAVLASDWLAQRDKDRDAAVAAKVAEAEVEGVDPSDMRDVGNWLVREADQRAKFFPQRRDGVDALMRHIASDLFRAGLAPTGPDGADEDNWRCMVCRAVVPSGVFDAHQAAHRDEGAK